MDTITDKIYITQSDVSALTQNVYDRLLKKEPPITKIVGIANGGLNVSIPLSKMFDLPHQQLRISFYEGDFIFDKQTFTHDDNDVVLLVDDLIDSGKTIKYFCEKYNMCQGKDLFVACLYYKFDNDHFQYANFYAEEKPDGWVHFPWE